MITQRIQKVQAALGKNKADAFLVSNPYNIFYLTGFKGIAPEDREAFALITQKNCYLITSKLYNPVFPNIRLFEPDKRLTYHISEVAKQDGVSKVVVESDNLTLAEYQGLQKKLPSLQFAGSQNFVEELRVLKDKKEIEMIKKACQLADLCLSEVMKTVEVGQTEREILFKIDRWMKDHGSEGGWYPPVVAIDKNTAVPHHDGRSGNTKLKKGSLILIDMGGEYGQYRSDITRMFFVGKIPTGIKEVYAKLLSAQEKTVAYVKKNQTGGEIDAYCRDLLKKQNLPTHPHVTGHGVGLEIHESPRISIGVKEKIRPGNVITIEPGIYFEGRFGIRIEDTVLVTEKSSEVLTKFPKKLTQL